MNDLQKVYPVSNDGERIISAYIDPETGEILDQDDLPEGNEELQKALVNKIKMSSGVQKVIQDEIKNLQGLLAIHQRREEGLKSFLRLIMAHAGVRKVDLGIAVVSIKKNPPRLVIEAGANVEAYTKMTVVETIDKNAIKLDLASGKEVPGCKLEQAERIDIK